MARPHYSDRGRQPFGPPATEIEQSKVRVALSEAEQRDRRHRDRRLRDEARGLQARFERLRAAIRGLQDDAEARRELRKEVAEAFERVMKFYSTSEVQQAVPAQATKVIRTARELRGSADTPHPSVVPVEAMLVLLVSVAALLKRKLAG